MGGYQNLPYIQGSVRRAMRGQTPPFLPEGYGYEPEAAPMRPPAMQEPGQAPPALEPPEDPSLKRVRELATQGPPREPKHGKLRTVLETIGRGFDVSHDLMDPGYSRERAEYDTQLKAASLAAAASEKEQRLRADLEADRARKASYEATAERQRRLMNAPPKADRQVVDGVIVERGADGAWKPVYGTPRPPEFKPGYGYERGGNVEVPVPTPPKLSTPMPGRDVPFSADVEEQKRRMAAAGRAPAGPDRGTPKQFADLDKNKLAELKRLKQWATDQVASYPETANATWGELRNYYQELQNSYEQQIAALGGNAEHFEYPSGAEFIAQQTGQAPATPKSAKPLTVEKAGEYLRKAGGDKDKARKMARQDGWTF